MDNDDLIGVLMAMAVLCLCFCGLSYGTYRYGRYAERRLLTSVLQEQIQEVYYQGRGDAEKDCREGFIK